MSRAVDTMPSQVLKSISLLDVQLAKCSKSADQLRSALRSNEVADRLASVEGAKLNVAVAFAIASLFYVSQNLHGKTGDANKPIQSELARIKDHVKQINAHAAEAVADDAAATAAIAAGAGGDEDCAAAATVGPAVHVNKEASKRIISHHLSSEDKPSSEQQKKKKQKKA